MTGWPGSGPGDEEFRRWIYDRMLERRVVLVSGRLDHDAAGRAAVELMTLDADGDEPIRLQLGCPDGELDAALSLMDVVELVGVPVEVLCVGTVGGAVVGVLAVAERRLGTATSSLLLREPGEAFAGSASEQAAWASFRAERWRTFCRRVAEACGRSPEDVAADFRRGRYLSGPEAVEYGLLDELARQPPEGRHGRLGFRPVR